MGNKNKGGDKKRKHDKVAAEVTPAAAPASSLFGGNKDSDLGGLFSAAAAFAIPTSATASSSRVTVQAAAPVDAEVSRKKAKKDKKAKAVESAPVVEEKEAEAAESMEVDDKDEAEAAKDSDAEEETEFVHESLKTPAERRKREAAGAGAQKWTPPDETNEDRDRRTVFIGNLDIEAIKSKSILNQLKAHLLTFAPSAKIESVRFRSVAFAAPTAALPGHEKEAEDKDKEATKRAEREKQRAAEWRATQAGGSTTGAAGNRRGDDEVVDKSKSFLDSKGKRKVAFIKHDFHSDAATCNAYVVFGHAHPDRPANVAPIMNPYEAAVKVQEANGSEFMERTIRVDHVRLPSAVGLASAHNALGKRDAWLPTGTDPKSSLFVGGLDYAAKEEDVRAFFEALVVTERGAAPEGHTHWVTGVRIVRDKDTQLGKGFGYVHFIDRESVDELIALPSTKLKFAKKPLRLQSCKTLPPKSNSRPAPTGAAAASGSKAGAKGAAAGKPAKKPFVPAGPIPKGNPLFGEKIKDLSKEDRKVAKATDAERQARRIAKKKAKVSAAHRETGAVKLAATKAEKSRVAKKVTAKKSRVRSAHALSKAKGKRA